MIASIPSIPSSYAQSPADIAKALERLVIKIVPNDGTARGRAASGLVVQGFGDRVLAATSSAAVADAKSVTVTDSVGKTYRAQVAFVDSSSGAAVIAIASWAGPRTVDIDARSLRPGEQVVVVGFDARRQTPSFTALSAEGLSKITGPLPGGFEGGPVVSIEQRVLGLVRSRAGLVIPAGAVSVAILAAARPPGQPAGPQPPPPPTPPGTGAPPTAPSAGVQIAAFPFGAAVSVDGTPAGSAPVRLPPSRLPPGRHRIRVTAAGRLGITVDTAVVTSTQEVNLVLPAVPAVEPTGALQTTWATARQSLLAGDAPTAVGALRTLLETPVALPEVRVYLAAALLAESEQNEDEAITLLRTHVNLNGETYKSLDAYVLLGALYERKGLFQDALTRYKLAVKVQPAYAATILQTPTVTDSAIRSLERAVLQNPKEPMSRIRLGLAYEAKGRFAEGMREFKAVLFQIPFPGAPPTTPVAGPSTGVLVRSFPRGAVLSVGDRVLGATPQTIPDNLADPLLVRLQLSRFMEIATTVGSRERRGELLFILPPRIPTNRGRTPFAQTKIGQGVAAAAAGDWVEAARLWRQALESDYTLVELQVYVGFAYFMQGRLPDALDYLRRFVNVQNTGPMALTAYALMGLAFDRQDRYQEALTRYKLALRLHPAMEQEVGTQPTTTDAAIRQLEETGQRLPNDLGIQYRLGVAYEAKGRFRDGMLALRRALFSLGPPP